MIDLDTKITTSDILSKPSGQVLLDELDIMFPFFSSITFKNGYFIVSVARGKEYMDLVFNDLDLDYKMSFTYSLEGHGAFVEASFNDVFSLMTRWIRESKINSILKK